MNDLMKQDVENRKQALPYILWILEVIEKGQPRYTVALELMFPYEQERVKAVFNDGSSKTINIAADSIASMTRDILKALGY